MTSCFNILWIFFFVKKSLFFFSGTFRTDNCTFLFLIQKKSFGWKPLKEPSSPKHCQKKKVSFLLSQMTRRSNQLTAFSNKDSLRCGLRSWSVAGTYRIMRSRVPIAVRPTCAWETQTLLFAFEIFVIYYFFCLLSRSPLPFGNFPIFSSLFSENSGSFIFFLCFFLYSLFLRSVFIVLLSQEERGETKMSNSKCPSFRKV